MVNVLHSKRESSRFQILVEIAAHQPNLRQKEVAERLGVTTQAISNYVRELVADGLVTTDGRRCYSVTKDGVERLLEGAAELKRYARMVMEEVIEHVSVWTALAEVDLAEGERVSLIFSLPRIIAVIRSKSLLKPLFLMSVMIKSVIAMHNLID